jgi:hypothetical protein
MTIVRNDVPERRFFLAIALLSLGYAVLQVIYIEHLPMVMDEFAGEAEVYRLTHSVPYRDFVPYKTVLGYYLSLPAALLVRAPWDRLMAIKVEIVLINTMVIAATAFYLRRFYSRTAALLGLAVFLCCSGFLERSSELRVDMLTAWAGLASFLLLMRGRAGWAGVLAAVSFLISQKGSFYVVAANAALGVHWIVFARTRAHFRKLVSFDAAAAAAVAVYFAVWSALSSPQAVFDATFRAAAGVALRQGYRLALYWELLIERNPAIFLFALMALVVLVMRWRRRDTRSIDVYVPVYAATVLAQMIWYPQSWPYFFVLMFPTLFVLHSAGFDALEQRVGKQARWDAVITFVVLIGVAYPLARVPVVLLRDNSYQRYNVKLAASILEPGDTYLAGVSLIQEHEQTLERLRWLDAARSRALHDASVEERLALVMQMDQHPPKLIIRNYRIRSLPQPFKDYFQRTYTRLTGSIYVYGPELAAGRAVFELPFDGRYMLDARRPTSIIVDGMVRSSGEYVHLNRGPHIIETSEPLRLRLLPPGIEQRIEPRLDNETVFFPSVYEY